MGFDTDEVAACTVVAGAWDRAEQSDSANAADGAFSSIVGGPKAAVGTAQGTNDVVDPCVVVGVNVESDALTWVSNTRSEAKGVGDVTSGGVSSVWAPSKFRIHCSVECTPGGGARWVQLGTHRPPA